MDRSNHRMSTYRFPKWFESSDPTDLYLPALVLASKFLHDSDTYDRASNAEWSEAANISTQHLNQLEWEFVQRLNWNVMVEEAEFDRWLGFFEYWVANDFLAKNGFCTRNEIAQLSSGLPLMAMIQSLLDDLSVHFFCSITLCRAMFFAYRLRYCRKLNWKSRPVSPYSGAMAPQFPDFRRVRRRIRRTLCYGSKQPQNVNLPLSELVVDYFNKRSPFDYISPETSASISDRGYADPCTLVVAMVYLDRLRVNDKKWFESSDPTDLYLPALVLASKFLHDSDTYDRASNAEWSEAANISTQHLNQLEWEFVQRLNWNVMVEEAEFDRWLGFFEYWVANDFLAKNGFCTYNEIAQLSSGLPLMAMIQSLVSFFSLMTLVYTFSVVSLFAVPCSLLRTDFGIVENSTGKAAPVPPLHSSQAVGILINLGDNQHTYWNENAVDVERINAETSICDSNSSALAGEANINVFACGINELGLLSEIDLCKDINHHLTDFLIYSLFDNLS
ncbi:Cyclin, partial [Ostertagia ostertagi]